jgi:hypothetical protein
MNPLALQAAFLQTAQYNARLAQQFYEQATMPYEKFLQDMSLLGIVHGMRMSSIFEKHMNAIKKSLQSGPRKGSRGFTFCFFSCSILYGGEVCF